MFQQDLASWLSLCLVLQFLGVILIKCCQFDHERSRSKKLTLECRRGFFIGQSIRYSMLNQSFLGGKACYSVSILSKQAESNGRLRGNPGLEPYY